MWPDWGESGQHIRVWGPSVAWMSSPGALTTGVQLGVGVGVVLAGTRQDLRHNHLLPSFLPKNSLFENFKLLRKPLTENNKYAKGENFNVHHSAWRRV